MVEFIWLNFEGSLSTIGSPFKILLNEGDAMELFYEGIIYILLGVLLIIIGFFI